MEVTLIHNSVTRKTVEMVFPAPLLDVAFKAAIEDISPKVKIPGFRPGKVPKSVLLSKFKSEIAKEVADKLIETHFDKAISEIGVQPISRPGLESAELREGAEGTLKIQFDVAPDVKLPEYKGTKLTRKKHRIDDAYVDEVMESIRQRAAKYVPIDGGAEAGHFVELDIKVKPQGMKQRHYEDESLQLDTSKPFDAELVGLKVDDIKKFTLHVPKEDTNRQMAGKQVQYEVYIKDVRALALSELNDDFAKDTGKYDTLQEYKDGIRKELEDHAESEAVTRLQSDVLNQLLEAAPFEVPSSMVNLQLDDYCREFADYVNRNNINFKKVDWRKLRQNRLNDAERAVRTGYLLQALGNAEDIQVSDEEIDQEIRKWMEESKSSDSFEAIKADFEKHGATTEIRGRVRTEKIFDLLLKHAVITEELLDTAAYRDLLEMERRRQEGIAQARFDAGGLEGGGFEEQEGGAPDAIKLSDEKTDTVVSTESADEGREETAPAKKAKTKKADAESPAETEVETKPKRGRPKKAE